MKDIKEIRRRILSLEKSLVPGSRNISLCKTNLQEARMLTGEILGLRSKYPYSSNKKTVNDIEPRFEDVQAQIKNPESIEDISDARSIIEAIINHFIESSKIFFNPSITEPGKFQSKSKPIPNINFQVQAAIQGATVKLILAKMHLGEELNSIKTLYDNSRKKPNVIDTEKNINYTKSKKNG